LFIQNDLMKGTPNLPGLPTMAMLLVAVLITIWLGVDGPIQFVKLKEWQTLMAAIIAPSIAFLAAIVAYRAAMAKVNFDREVHEETTRRQRRGLMLRLRFALEHAIDQGDALWKMLHLKVGNDGEITLTSKMLSVFSPPEIDEAWKDLGLFDETLARKIADIKIQCRQMEIVRSQWSSDQEWTFTASNPPEDLLLLAKLDGELDEQSKIAIELLQARIVKG
jgi:hypothetical protein